jgi:hypothetical protein
VHIAAILVTNHIVFPVSWFGWAVGLIHASEAEPAILSIASVRGMWATSSARQAYVAADRLSKPALNHE